MITCCILPISLRKTYGLLRFQFSSIFTEKILSQKRIKTFVNNSLKKNQHFLKIIPRIKIIIK